MNQIVFIAMFLGFGIFLLIVGLVESRKVNTVLDYFLAGRTINVIPITLTLLATQIGSGMLLGTAEESYNIGYYGIMYSLGIALGFLILALGLASKMRSLHIVTTSEVFEKKYHSPTLNKIASIFSAITLLGIVIGQIIASRLFLHSIGIHNELIIILFWLIILTYTTIGGLKSVIFTDAFQIVLVIGAFSILFIYMLQLEPASIFSMQSLIERQQAFYYEGTKLTSFANIILMPALFTLIGQDVAQRFFACRTNATAKLASLLASLVLVLFAIIPIYFGIKARLLGLPPIGNPILQVIKVLQNNYILMIASCGIIASIASTGDSILIAISSNLHPLFKRNNLNLARLITFISGIIGFVASYFMPGNVIKILIESYSISVSCLFVSIMIGYFKDNLNKNAAISSIMFGAASLILFSFYPIAIPKEIAALFLSFIGYFIGDRFKVKQTIETNSKPS